MSEVAAAPKRKRGRPRKDPQSVPVDYSVGFDKLVGGDHKKWHYTAVQLNNPVQGKGMYEALGYELCVFGVTGNEYFQRFGIPTQGDPTPGPFGTHLMRIDRKRKQEMDAYKMQRSERIEKRMFNKSGGDPFHGTGLSGMASLYQKTEARELGRKEARELLEG